MNPSQASTTVPAASGSDPSRAAPSEDRDFERRTGQGAILLTAGKFWFLASAFIIQWALSRVMALGVSEEEGQRLYGVYSSAASFATILNALVYQGTVQAVARFVGRAPQEHRAVRRAAMRLQAALGGGLSILLFSCAPLIADRLYANENLTQPLRLAAIITAAYAFYAVTMGSFTGSQLFRRQALVDLSYSTLRVVFIVCFAWLLGSSLGRPEAAVAGWAFASVLVLGMSLAMAPRGPVVGHLGVGELFRFEAVTMLLSGLTALATQLDINLVQMIGPGDQAAREMLAGQYRAAQQLATVPYSAVFAITFILFPLVSAASGKDAGLIRGYIAQTTRYALVIALMFALAVVSAPARAVGLLYKTEYQGPAAAPLGVLVLGYVSFSVVFIMISIVTASGRPLVSAALVAVMVLLQGAVGLWSVPNGGTLGAAQAAAIGMTATLVIASATLKRMFGAGLDLGMAVRALVAAAVGCAVSHALLADRTVFGTAGLLAGFQGGLVRIACTLTGFSCGVAVFIVLLFVIGVFGPEDRARFARVLGKKRHA